MSAPRLGGKEHWQGNRDYPHWQVLVNVARATARYTGEQYLPSDERKQRERSGHVTQYTYFLGASAGGSAGLLPRKGVVSPIGNPDRAE